jgi:pectate lyase
VTTLAALEAAVAGDAKKIVIISGTLTSTESEGVAVRPGSNTSILGAQGASKSSPAYFYKNDNY